MTPKSAAAETKERVPRRNTGGGAAIRMIIITVISISTTITISIVINIAPRRLEYRRHASEIRRNGNKLLLLLRLF